MISVAIVTGAGSGIGRAVAIRLAHEGHPVAVNDLDPARAQAVADEILADGGLAKGFGGDVSDEKDVAALVAGAEAEYGPAAVLVNNAGFVQQALFVDLTPADWDRMFAVHVRGTFLCTRAVLPGIHDSQRGFKAFSAAAAEAIFPRCRVDGWAFDIEVLAIARGLGFTVREVPIEWHHTADSRVRPTAYLTTLVAVASIRRRLDEVLDEQQPAATSVR